MARNRQISAIGRVVECGHHRWRLIHGRIALIVLLDRIARRVILRTLADPSANQLDLSRLQWIPLVRHLCLTIDGSDQFDQQTLIRLMRNDRHFLATTGEKSIELGHHKLALGLGRLVTAMTVGLEDGTNFSVVTDLFGFLHLGFVSKRNHRQHQ